MGTVEGSFDIPPYVTDATKRLLGLLGIRRLFEPQYLALSRGVERGVNLVVASPTGSGKTLISLIAIANRLLSVGGKAYYLVPLKSVAQEKYSDFRVLESMGLRVKISVGDFREGHPDAEVIIATYEKLDSLLRSQPSIVREASVVVVDEIHNVSEPKRGPALESIITRLLHAGETQIIGLSATVPNVDEIAGWIGGEAVVSSWRPVPLREYVFKGYKLYSKTGSVREVKREVGLFDLDLAIETLQDGGQVLVFTSSRRRAVSMARRASKRLGKYLASAKASEWAAKARSSEGAPRLVAEELAAMMQSGVAYHHAGLPPSLRRIVEDAYRQGALSIVYSTPTLAAGVNLPARRVIIDSYYRFERGVREPIRIAEYKQMAGRAGRPGLDDYGEAVLIAEPGDSPQDLVSSYLLGLPEPVESRLGGLRGLRHFILGAVSARMARSKRGIARLAAKTLYHKQRGVYRELLEKAISDLARWGLIEVEGDRVSPTPLGRELAIVYLDPETIPILKSYAKSIRQDNEFDLLFLIALMPDMIRFPASRREESRLMDEILSASPTLLSSIEWLSDEDMSAVKTAAVLKLWIEEASEDLIYGEWGVHSGDLLAAVDTAEWIASAIARISPHIGLSGDFQMSLETLASRIRYGVKTELLQLVRIPGVGRVRARILFDNGFRSLEDLSAATPQQLMRLHLIGPSVARQILEYLGRIDEALSLAHKESIERRGLLAFLDSDTVAGEEAD